MKGLLVSVLVVLIAATVSAGPVHKSKRPLRRARNEDTTEQMGEMMETATDKASMMPPLELPSNATSIRADITDTFSCENRGYGYYADVENECQIFHVCLPVMNADERKERTFRWSFICPEETVFSQVVFTCVRMEDMPNECKDSEQYYQLNNNFGMAMGESETMKETDSEMMATENTEEQDNNQEQAAQEMQQMIEKIEMTTDAKIIMEEKPTEATPVEETPSEETPVAEEKPVEETPVAEEKPAEEMVDTPAAVEEEQKVDEMNSGSGNRDSDMTDGLLPPLDNEVYRVGTNGEAQMSESETETEAEAVAVAEAEPVAEPVVEAEANENQLDEVQELEEESATAALPVVLDLKESVIQAVENIIGEEAAAEADNETPEVAAIVVEDAKKSRRINTDPRGRRFLFRADAKRHH